MASVAEFKESSFAESDQVETIMKTLLKHLLPVVTATFACSLAADGQEQGTKPAAAQFPVIQMQNVPLSVALENLARQAAINFTIDSKITDKVSTPVTLRWENMTASNALVRLLKERELFIVDNPQTGVSKVTATNSPPRVFEKELFSGSKDVIPWIQLMDAPLKTAFADLGTKAGLKLELDADLANPSKPFKEQIFVSVRFENLTGGQALAAVCDQHNLQIAKSENGEVWRISRGK